MQSRHLTILAVLTLALTLLVGGSVLASHAATSNTQGYVRYNITLTNNTQVRTFTFSESVQPSSIPGRSQLTVTISSPNTNLSYSRLENSSRILFPILPITNSETFNYEMQGVSFQLTLTRTGTSTALFNNTAVKLTNYDFQGLFTLPYSAQYGNIQMKPVQGQLSLLPSDLLYSLQANLYQDLSLKIQLVSTSIALDLPSTQANTLTSQIVLGGSVAAGIIAVGLGAFYLLKRFTGKSAVTSATTDKPSYWVD